MSLFTRHNGVNSSLAATFSKAGWLTMLFNFVTLFLHFFGVFAKSNIQVKYVGSAVLSALILGIEYATMTVLFEPGVMNNFIQNNYRNEVSKYASYGCMAFCVILSGYSYYFDWKVNLSAFKLNSISFEYVVLGFALVLMSEMFFWISHILTMSQPKSEFGGVTQHRK